MHNVNYIISKVHVLIIIIQQRISNFIEEAGFSRKYSSNITNRCFSHRTHRNTTIKDLNFVLNEIVCFTCGI